MTRQEFIEKHRHEFGGLVLDAATVGLTGQALSVFLRQIMRRIDAKLSVCYDQLAPTEKPLPVTNGRHTAVAAKGR